MTERPVLDPEGRNYISCPHCTIQIRDDVPECPYCRQVVPRGAAGKPKDIRELLVPPNASRSSGNISLNTASG